MSNTKFTVVSKDTLVEATNKGIEIVQKEMPGIIVITGARAVMNHQTGKKESLELEFLQQRTLEGRTLNALALSHEGDDCWNNGTIKMRIWITITKQVAIKALGFSEETVDALIEQSQSIKENERLVVMEAIKFLNTPEGQKEIKIVCNETTNVHSLEPIKIPYPYDESYAKFLNKYILKEPSGKDKTMEKIVDTNGNTIYRWFTLGFKNQQDNLVPNKISLSNYLANSLANYIINADKSI